MVKTEMKQVVMRSRLWQRIGLLLLAAIIAFTPTLVQATDEQWEPLGSLGLTGIGPFNSLAMDGATPYAAFADTDNDGKLTVKRYNGSTWEMVGTPLDGEINTSSFALSGSTPYIAISDSDNTLTVKRFNGTSWETVGTPLENTTYYPYLVFNGTTPYILYPDASHDWKATVIRFNGTSWETVGDAGFSSANVVASLHPTFAFSGTTPYVVLNEDDGNKLTVMKYNGSSWETVGDAGFSPHMGLYPHLAINGSTPYVTFTDATDDSYAPVVMQYNGTDWETVGNFTANTGYPTLTFVNSTPYVALTDLTDYTISVKRYNGTDWETVGSTGVTGLPVSLISSDNWLYTMSVDAAGDQSLSVMRYNIGESGGDSGDTVSLPNAENGKSVELTVPSATAISSSSTVKESTLASKDSAYDYPLGLVNFRFTTAATDNTATLQFVTDLKPYQVVARKYNPATKEYTTISDAIITETTYNGQHALQLSYTITDNGPLDLDPTAGVIDDPVGLAVLTVPGAPNTGVGRSEVNGGIALLFSTTGLIVIAFAVATPRHIHKFRR